jgi:pyruvate/2-oxoglutarate dehydrogenase complex dihydrolipoamide dehydrogenase (E3) component
VSHDYDLVIVGGGSAGQMAAPAAAALDARVTLVDRERLGGECL